MLEGNLHYLLLKGDVGNRGIGEGFHKTINILNQSSLLGPYLNNVISLFSQKSYGILHILYLINITSFRVEQPLLMSNDCYVNRDERSLLK